MLAVAETLLLRPLSLDDCRPYREFVRALDADDLRLRFAGAMRFDWETLCRRFLDIDHTHEAAFGAFDGDTLLGVARLVRTAPGEADFALIVRSDRKRGGVGRTLLRHVIAAARAQGLQRLCGDVLYENIAMRQLARSEGFRAVAGGGPMVQVVKEL